MIPLLPPPPPPTDRGMIHAPSVQYVEHGVEYSQLNCSYPGALPTWTYDGQTVSGELFAPSFGDEGVYICDLFYSDPARQIQASIRQEIRLHVFGELSDAWEQ